MNSVKLAYKLIFAFVVQLLIITLFVNVFDNYTSRVGSVLFVATLSALVYLRKQPNLSK